MNPPKQTRRQFLKQLGLTAISVAASKNIFSCAKPQKPNFVFILVDDLGWTDLGCFGSTFYETPNINHLASEGMRFTDAYAACPVCSPTRASIMAGKYPARMNTTDWFGAPQPETAKNHWTRNKPLLPAPYIEHLPLEEVTVAETLKQNGYATFFAGKWHLGREGFYPENRALILIKAAGSAAVLMAGENILHRMIIQDYRTDLRVNIYPIVLPVKPAGLLKLIKRNHFLLTCPYGNQGGSPGAAVREGDFKLIEFFEDNHIELYNLKDDIGERNNLANTNPKKVKEMLGKLHQWQKDVGAGMVTPNPDYEKI